LEKYFSKRENIVNVLNVYEEFVNEANNQLFETCEKYKNFPEDVNKAKSNLFLITHKQTHIAKIVDTLKTSLDENCVRRVPSCVL